jgi:hypothetical protein
MSEIVVGKMENSGNRQPISAAIVGYKESTGEPFRYTFLFKRKIQGRRFSNLLLSAQRAQRNPLAAAEIILPFLESALLNADERARFQALTAEDNDEEIVEVDDMVDLVYKLVEKYGGDRPLGTANSSSSGPNPSGTTSVDTGGWPGLQNPSNSMPMNS